MNDWYPKALQGLGEGKFNLPVNKIKVYAVDAADYTYDPAHEFLNSVTVAARVASTAALGGVTFTNGVFDASDTVFAGAAGDTFEKLLIVVAAAAVGDADLDHTLQRLLIHIDTVPAGALSVSPNGSDIAVTWPDDATKIAAL